ncbi:MAG: T9SS type A sorting domain-containing protein [Bacteroidia bacterium]|nr:T9SS type A sorting domain-containing protein [Bacteroidia bacterium]
MKKIFLASLFFVLTDSTLFSQSLLGIWQGFNSGQLIGYYKFTSTTMEFSTSGSNFTLASNVTLTANSMTITDALFSGCPANQVGTYTLNFITNDDVQFHEVNDPCTGRKNALTSFNWVRVTTTSLESLVSAENPNLPSQNVPNPFSDKTCINFSLTKSVKEPFLLIHDLSGREINKYPLDKQDDYIEIYTENLSNGVYLYMLVCDEYASPSRRMIVSGH